MAKYSNRQVSTIQGAIAYGMTQDVRYGTYHEITLIQNEQTGEIIRVPAMSLMNKYRHFLQEIVTVKFKMSDEEFRKYKYAPKRLSFDLYGTTEYWSALLELNNCLSISDFNKQWVKAYDPKRLPSYVNEILIKEGLL